MPPDAPMADEGRIFDFELDFARTLRCIPMIVRLKLDLCGIKLSLRQWSRFDVEDRRQLIGRPCRTAEETAAWRAVLVGLISERAGELPVELPIDPHPAWDDRDVAPGPIIDRCEALGLPRPSSECWAALSQLQRFTLVKLTRGGHDNDNFGPALREFGVLEP